MAQYTPSGDDCLTSVLHARGPKPLKVSRTNASAYFHDLSANAPDKPCHQHRSVHYMIGLGQSPFPGNQRPGDFERPMNVSKTPADRMPNVASTALLSDADLLRMFAVHHDREAVAAIVARHGPMVMGTCRSILRNEHDAADAFQATFLVLLRKARSIGRPASLGSWLHGVARRVAHRAKARSVERPAREGFSSHIEPTDGAIAVISEECCNFGSMGGE